MIKFDVRNRFSGAVQFTAEIDCAEDEVTSIKLGLCVKWALENGASLDGASLDGASLYRANLDGANLNGANLNGANLDWASLDGANLNGAILYRASLDGASLDGASLDGANLYRANLVGANLNGANLDGASLYRASLDGANLNGASGLNDFIKCIQVEEYPVVYTADVMQIGCERHSLTEWAGFDDARILRMDGKRALKFWRKWKGWIFQAIELAPAKPTKQEQEI